MRNKRLPGRASADYAVFDLKRELSGGRERTAWNPVRSIPTKDFEFSAAEESRPVGRSYRLWS
jgi:hypothetical protein